ncbi:MAG: exodeoxyribonuclease V subunit gamma [Chitinivibrionales bacterium]|nr:exodeoxyribonuclease V subunit gamma [Chitinivibrionales bacterium]
MATIQLYTSNTLQLLADKFCDICIQEPREVFKQEIVVIPSGGMQRYIQLSYATRASIAANFSFPFPNHFLTSISSLDTADTKGGWSFSVQNGAWIILKYLLEAADNHTNLPSQKVSATQNNSIQELNRIEDDRSKFFDSIHRSTIGSSIMTTPAEALPEKLWQLSQKIAETFNRYCIYRPNLLVAWENGMIASEQERWQAYLWRVLVQTMPSLSSSYCSIKQLYAVLNQIRSAALPVPLGAERIVFFGFSHLAPLHLDAIKALATRSTICIFSLNPCREYWDDIVSEKKLVKKNVTLMKAGKEPHQFHYETGNELLASLGNYGKDFFTLLHSSGCEESGFYIEPDTSSLLGRIQSDILNLQQPSPEQILSASDRSIQIHACHSHLREVEVLHDHLLDLFEKEPTLAPEDVAVLLPDVELYAPAITMVFGSPIGSSVPKIPYAIADQAADRGQLLDVLLAIGECALNDFPPSKVIDILDREPMRMRWNMTPSEIAAVRKWLTDTAITSGVDDSTHPNSWENGISRLFLSFAMERDGPCMFQDIVPHSKLSNQESETLAKLTEFLTTLFKCAETFCGLWSLRQWSQRLLSILNTCLIRTDQTEPRALAWDEQSRKQVEAAISKLSEKGLNEHFTTALPYACIRLHLKMHRDMKNYGRNFLAGGVTFCTMLPMRSIPFKVICLLGMGFDTFPRKQPQLSFDLIVNTTACGGDRNIHDDDRYCFLETLVSSRHILYISYLGKSPIDNSTLQPSVVVTELIDYIRTTTAPLQDMPIETRLVTHHSISGASLRYFREDSLTSQARLFSYAKHNFDAAVASQTPYPLAEKKFVPPEFLLPSTVTSPTVLPIDQFCLFFSHPVKFYLKNILGIELVEKHVRVADVEPLLINQLQQYIIASNFIRYSFSHGCTPDHYYRILYNQGLLPVGAIGRAQFDLCMMTIQNLLATLRPWSPDIQANRELEVCCWYEPFIISGRIPFLTDHGLLRYKAGNIKVSDKVRLWIHHLLLNGHAESIGKESSLIALNGEQLQFLSYKRCDNARQMLGHLVQLYITGHTRPLPFFPETGYRFIHAIRNRNTSDEEAAEAAQQVWEGNPVIAGESNDVYYRLFPGSSSFFSDDFCTMTHSVLDPLFDHAQEQSHA